MLLQISLQDILDFLEMYWVLIAFLGGVVWVLIKMYFKQKEQDGEIKAIKTGQIVQIRDEINGLSKKIDAHDVADKKMEEGLLNRIDRNHTAALTAASAVKDKLDTAAMLHSNKLDSITRGLITVETKMDLILDGRIKTN